MLCVYGVSVPVERQYGAVISVMWHSILSILPDQVRMTPEGPRRTVLCGHWSFYVSGVICTEQEPFGHMGPKNTPKKCTAVTVDGSMGTFDFPGPLLGGSGPQMKPIKPDARHGPVFAVRSAYISCQNAA